MKHMPKIIMLLLAATIALGLKYHYSHADAGDLDWILKPTACLVEMTGSLDFEKVENAGYVNNENSITIAPECSGVNFMIILFCLSAFLVSGKVKKTSRIFIWIMLCLSIAFSYTLVVNAIRIHLSIYSFKTALFQNWYTRETVHLVEGVLIYFIFLLIYHFLLSRIINTGYNITGKWQFRQIKTGLIPLFFYLALTLLVPVINHRGLPQGDGFIHYAAVVLITCPLVLLLFFSTGACCHWLSVRLKCFLIN